MHETVLSKGELCIVFREPLWITRLLFPIRFQIQVRGRALVTGKLSDFTWIATETAARLDRDGLGEVASDLRRLAMALEP